jgi:uncharacterized phage protein gp47/JayE
MTTYGLTATGFVRKTYEQIVADMRAFMRDRISPKLVLDATTPEGNIVEITADELDPVWEAAEAAAGALDPDNAAEALLVGLCKLSGIYREPATAGTVSVTLTFTAATTIASGALLLSVSGESSNLWSNDEEIVATEAGTVAADFTSTTASAAAIALAGTLTVIATPTTGLASATNPLDATPGTDIEKLDALRLRREASLGATGKGTTNAIRAEVAAVDGVIDVRVVENDTNETAGGIPARTVYVVVWDGVGEDAEDAEIAQAIYDAKAAATPTHGTESATAVDPWGDTKTQYWDRAEVLEAYISITVTGTATEAAIVAALLAAHDELIGEDLLFAALFSAGFRVAGVTNVTALTLGLAPAPGATADIPATGTQVVVLDSSRIVVTLA